MHRPVVALALVTLASVASAVVRISEDELTEIVVTAPEPRYVAPTTLDGIGRVWVPVKVNGQGPFRLVLDTGAQRSALTTTLAQRLQLPRDRTPPVLLHGVTGSAITPTVAIEHLKVGDLSLQPASMPVVPDVFGGADGLLGTDGMQDHRIYIDFRNDLISISRSRNRAAEAGFSTLRFLSDPLPLLVVRARVGNVPVRAIIDTGAQATAGNLALRDALRRRVRTHDEPDRLQGATGDWQNGVGARLPPLQLGSLTVRDARVTFADLHIFGRWEMDEQPTLLIGMDLIGLMEQMVIDYRRRELQIKPRERG